MVEVECSLAGTVSTISLRLYTAFVSSNYVLRKRSSGEPHTLPYGNGTCQSVHPKFNFLKIAGCHKPCCVHHVTSDLLVSVFSLVPTVHSTWLIITTVSSLPRSQPWSLSKPFMAALLPAFHEVYAYRLLYLEQKVSAVPKALVMEERLLTFPTVPSVARVKTERYVRNKTVTNDDSSPSRNP